MNAKKEQLKGFVKIIFFCESLMVWRLNCFLFFSRWVVGLNFCAGRLLQCPRDEAFPSSYYRLDGWINLRCCLVSYIFILVIFFDHQYGSYQLFFRKKGRRNEAVVILSRRFEMRLPEGHWWLVYARIEGTRERESTREGSDFTGSHGEMCCFFHSHKHINRARRRRLDWLVRKCGLM